MTEDGVIRMLAGLFTAAGKTAGQAEVAVYGDVLARIPDEVGLEAGRQLWAHVSWEHPPSPRMVMEQAQSILRRSRQVGLPADTSRPAPPEVAAEWAAKIREQMAAATGPLAKDLRRAMGPLVRTPNQPDFEPEATP